MPFWAIAAFCQGSDQPLLIYAGKSVRWHGCVSLSSASPGTRLKVGVLIMSHIWLVAVMLVLQKPYMVPAHRCSLAACASSTLSGWAVGPADVWCRCWQDLSWVICHVGLPPRLLDCRVCTPSFTVDSALDSAWQWLHRRLCQRRCKAAGALPNGLSFGSMLFIQDCLAPASRPLSLSQ